MNKNIVILLALVVLTGCTSARDWSGQALGRVADKITPGEGVGLQRLIGTVSKVAWIERDSDTSIATMFIEILAEDGHDYLVTCAPHIWEECNERVRGDRAKFNGKPENSSTQRFNATYLEEK